jgi:ectoine hydroxylase-related dioxygenase (phytanoyl-CoA dioxygenase family)
MQFIPGSHRQEIVAHQSINNDPRIHGLEVVDAVDEAQAAICELPAGGATFHGGRMLHATGANRSNEPRRAYIVGFGLENKPRATPRSFPWLEKKKTAREERSKAAKATI